MIVKIPIFVKKGIDIVIFHCYNNPKITKMVIKDIILNSFVKP